MPYISLQPHLPGITGLLEYRQDTALPIRELTQFLLRGPNSLSEADRELIATIVSNANECNFCTTAHAATADMLIGDSATTIHIRNDVETAPVTPKLKHLKSGVNHIDEEEARPQGVYDVSMRYAKAFNNKFAFKLNIGYFSGLDWYANDYTDISPQTPPANRGRTSAPSDRTFYTNRAPMRAEQGYLQSVSK